MGSGLFSVWFKVPATRCHRHCPFDSFEKFSKFFKMSIVNLQLGIPHFNLCRPAIQVTIENEDCTTSYLVYQQAAHYPHANFSVIRALPILDPSYLVAKHGQFHWSY